MITFALTALILHMYNGVTPCAVLGKSKETGKWGFIVEENGDFEAGSIIEELLTLNFCQNLGLNYEDNGLFKRLLQNLRCYTKIPDSWSKSDSIFFGGVFSLAGLSVRGLSQIPDTKFSEFRHVSIENIVKFKLEDVNGNPLAGPFNEYMAMLVLENKDELISFAKSAKLFKF